MSRKGQTAALPAVNAEAPGYGSPRRAGIARSMGAPGPEKAESRLDSRDSVQHLAGKRILRRITIDGQAR